MEKTRVLYAAVIMTILFCGSTRITSVSASLPFDTGVEYTSGTSTSIWGGVWYTWINSSETQVIFTAMYSDVYNSPVHVFLGEHYNSTLGQPVLVGNALTMIEVYNDTNQNGILDASYTATTSELEYYITVNSSKTFNASPVQKIEVNSTSHYRWGVTYGGIDAFLLYPTPYDPGYGAWSLAATMNLSELGLSYDYSIEQNTTFLKASYQIGNFTLLQKTNSSVSIEGLSISLLYTTQVVSPRSYMIMTDNNPFNSTQNNPTTSISNALIKLGNLTTFEFRFQDNYTLYNSVPTEYATKYSACPTDSIDPQLLRENWNTPFWFVKDNMEELFPDIGSIEMPFNMNLTTSSFNYRIQYPEWSGNRMENDPTYVAFTVPEFPWFTTLTLLTTVTFLTMIVRKRKQCTR